MEGMPKKILGRATLDKDVFEASVLCYFIVSFKRCYDEYLLWFFFTIVEVKTFWWFFPFQNVIANLSVFVARVLNKDVSQAIIGTFYQCYFQKMVEWVVFKFSLLCMLKFKWFKMWRPMSLFILLPFLLCVWKVIPYRKGMSWGMCSL